LQNSYIYDTFLLKKGKKAWKTREITGLVGLQNSRRFDSGEIHGAEKQMNLTSFVKSPSHKTLFASNTGIEESYVAPL
jgi:hypothetical protein